MKLIAQAVLIFGLLIVFFGWGIYLAVVDWRVPLSEVAIGPYILWIVIGSFTAGTAKAMGAE